MSAVMPPHFRAWAEIHLDAIEKNYAYFAARCAEDGVRRPVIAVIKADAYGHGAPAVAQRLSGVCGTFAVATLEEARALRQAGIEQDIVILGYTESCHYRELIALGIMPTLWRPDEARSLADCAGAEKRVARAQVAVDSGMRRIGIYPDKNGEKALREMLSLPHLRIEGIFTHFAAAAYDPEYTRAQGDAFARFLARAAAEEGIVRHAAATDAALGYPQYRLDAVRVGLGLYGYTENAQAREALSPAMTFKSRVADVRTAGKDETVGYGRTFRASGKTTIATVSVGYADGYRIVFSNLATAAIRGAAARVAGRVCMDMTMFDVTKTGAEIGDEAVLWGRGGAPLWALAAKSNASVYELLCGVSPRVRRLYD